MSARSRFRSARLVSIYGSVVLSIEDTHGRLFRKLNMYLPLPVHRVFVRPMSFLRNCFATLFSVRMIMIDQDKDGAITCQLLKVFPEVEVIGITSSKIDSSVVECMSQFRNLRMLSFAGSILPPGSTEKLKSLSSLEELNLNDTHEGKVL